MASTNSLTSRSPVEPTPIPAPSSTMGPPRKRRRLEDDVHVEITSRKMEDLQTSLEVDHMILDYLLSQAIDICFANPHSTLANEVPPVERSLLQVDEFYSLFKRRYRGYKLDEGIRFRQQLLQLVALFTQRLTQNSTTLGDAAIKHLRKGNGARARRWIGDASRIPSAAFNTTPFDAELPLPRRDIDDNRAHVLDTLGAPVEDDAYDDAFYGTSASTSLLDLLPLFMKVSAVCMECFDYVLNDQWMELAAQWMLQASLEQYLVYGQSGSDAMDEAFAWGYKENRNGNARDIHEKDEDVVNAMFEENGVEVKRWLEIRAAALQELAQLADANGLSSHLLRLASDLPIDSTQETIIDFLQSCHRCLPKPVLAQLEGGQLDGMSEEETKKFIQDCGLDLESFLGA